MKRVSVQDLIPGMITAEDVYTYADQLIIPRGAILTDKTITKLEFYSIISVRIEDNMAEGFAPKPVETVTELSYSEKIKQSEEYKEFKSRFDREVVRLKEILNSVALNERPLDLDEMIEFTYKLLQQENGYLSVFDMLHNMRMYDDMTYAHAINVALMCNVFARWLHMTVEETRLATLCGLLHDIGKITVPGAVIKKPGKLTESEYEIVKKHSIDGYNILKRYNIPDAIKNAALMHHERCDGSGYPLGLKNSKIDSYAKMVAIVDVYDAMTSARIYRGPMCPFEVVDIFENEGLQKYDTRFIMTFLENIVNTYMLNRVKLNDGRVGEVVFINRSHLAQPTIKCDNEFIDLSQEQGLYIQEIL